MKEGFGGVAQLGEHLICIQKAAGSIPVTSTKKKRVAKPYSFLSKQGSKRKNDLC